MKTAARVISYIFHPLLITTYLVLLFNTFIPQFIFIRASDFSTIISLIFILTFVLPAANIIIFKAFGTLPSFQMESRRERILPFIVITLTYGVVAWLFFYRWKISFNLSKVMLVVALLVLGATLATFFQKVSIHTLAMFGVVGILLPLNKAAENGVMRWPIVVALVVTGLVMSSRLYLNAHTSRELLVGGLIGFSVGLLGMVFLFH